MMSTPRECRPGTVGGLKSIPGPYDSGYTPALASIEVIRGRSWWVSCQYIYVDFLKYKYFSICKIVGVAVRATLLPLSCVQ